MPFSEVANFPLWFLTQCATILGYPLNGIYTPETPHLDLEAGAFTATAPAVVPFVSDEDAKALGQLLENSGFDTLKNVQMNAAMRYRLLDWYIAFLHRHTDHLGAIRSLGVLQTILH